VGSCRARSLTHPRTYPAAVLLVTLLATAPVVVTDDDTTLPDGCRPAQVAETLHARFGTPAVHVDEVIVGHANGLGQIEFSATVAGRRAHGKGALDCPARSIVAFGMGPEPGRIGPLCPPPPRRTRATIACARHWR
jgi:hypothetical protein